MCNNTKSHAETHGVPLAVSLRMNRADAPELWTCREGATFVYLPCGCQNFTYPCGYACEEHDHILCDGQPATGPAIGLWGGDRFRHGGQVLRVATSRQVWRCPLDPTMAVIHAATETGKQVTLRLPAETVVEYVYG